MTSLELAKKAAAFLDNKKAERVHVIEIENISSLADYFVIATGNNNTHVRALADELEEKLKGEGLPPARVEGYRSNPHELGKYLALFFGVCVFILCGFEHCVANMYYFTMGGAWSGRAILYLLVMTLGNAVGGVIGPVTRKILTK